ncbi:ribose ABC transporter permease protein [Clostridium coskatii]|uniref:L-arabinose transporter permease protein n=2 Tax=Clostridium coskatii TaxID=1705578 RepID=A0A166TL46_9CLOT|nr:L-arabinose transporter permease protein [Clostridium coskatii]OBR96114.1 ribose ABC transporter permease protein [Clostridium coskatii]
MAISVRVMRFMKMKFVKRENISKNKEVSIRIIAILLAFVVMGILFAALKCNPISVYISMFKGAFGGPNPIKQTINSAIPLAITALGIAIGLKLKYYNIGGEGQIIMGAFGAALVAFHFSNMPAPILIILMFASGILFSGIWGFIPGFFKVKWRANETITTLMMNYIALKFVTYLQYGPWKDPSSLGFPKMPNFSSNAILPSVFGVHIGWIIAILLAIFVYIFLNHTKTGYEISVIGESENTAKYAGIGIKKTTLIAIVLSAVFCGVTGVIQSSAIEQTLSTEITGGVGYTGIIIAWISNLNPVVSILVSILFAGLLQGGSFIQTAFGIPNSVASILQSVILFFVLGSEFFIRFRLSKGDVNENDNKNKKVVNEV